jgi:predicted O-methyltransferase YrrM
MLKSAFKNIISYVPYFKSLLKELNDYKKELGIYKTQYPPGHYYNPMVSPLEIKEKENAIFSIKNNSIEGIDLNESGQLDLIKTLLENYASVPFKDEKTSDLRYYFNNNFYSYSDGIFLNLMMRKFKPKSIIEIGSGFSSALMMDSNELNLNKSISFTFIDPNPERLYSLIKADDKSNYEIIAKKIQDISLDIFGRLNKNDILFIDSTHVSKTGSDVNMILFDILPKLKPGVLIHFHDIFYPFEYPKEWVLNPKGFGWNENYILRSFLMYNNQYKIVLFNTFLEHFHENWFRENMPLCLKNKGGSIWIQKQ